MRAKILLTVLLGGSLVLGWQTLTADGFGKLDSTLAAAITADSNQTHDVMIKLKQQTDLSKIASITNLSARKQMIYKRLTETAQATQGPLLALLNSQNIKHRAFYIVNMVQASGLTPAQIREISKRSEIARVYTDANLDLLPEPIEVPSLRLLKPGVVETNIQAIGAERVWKELNTRGKNIVVAGQDTGVEWDHPALKNQYRGSGPNGEINHNFNWYDAIREPITGGSSCTYASNVPCDDNDHGTHTVGTIVGNDGGVNEIGVAPESEWVACRNMDAGTGRPHTYLACFEFFLAPYPTDGNPQKDGRPDKAPHVMNNSWGCPDSELCQGDVLLEALRTLKAAGMFVVVSAGNSGPGCSTIQDTPAWHSADSFSIGAYDHRSGNIAGFSSRGPSSFDGGIGPDLVAPGVNIRSSITGKKYQGGMWSGTSMAGPHAVGVVALMWSAQPNLIGKIDETIDILLRTADPVPSADCMGGGKPVVPNNVYGHGRINAYNAVKASLGL